jgi:hypothetical protein
MVLEQRNNLLVGELWQAGVNVSIVFLRLDANNLRLSACVHKFEYNKSGKNKSII